MPDLGDHGRRAQTGEMGVMFWNYKESRKNHDCVRGCKIPEWSAYFTYQNRVGWDSALKICAKCMAMILYFTGLAYMSFYLNTHWDIGSQNHEDYIRR